MLKQRIITALWLLPLMLGMLFLAPSSLWAPFCGLIALLVLREYGNMCRFSVSQNQKYLIFTALFMMLAALGGWELPSIAWLLVLAFWLAMMPMWLVKKWTLPSDWRAFAIGLLLVLPFWFALVSLRPSTEQATSLLAIMGLVWVADIFAYFSGKALGKHKLAPAISPGKSWEGAIGGAVCVVIYMTIVWHAGWLAFDTSWFGTMVIGFVLTIVSICGDLLESWLKRAAGVKDSSNLLPGHGGVFDRTDSLIAVLSVYAAMMALFT